VSQIKIGTRASKLAVAQAELVGRKLRALGREVELVKITTSGDRIAGSLAESGGKGLWVLELERGLLDGTIDLAVHSAKDLPVELMDGLTIGAYPEREDPRDVFLGAPGRRFTSLPPGSRVGTSSQRRTALLRALRPELQPVPIRGNVPTRIAKIESLGLDGIIVAAAGLIRLGLEDHILDPLDPERYLPAGGQGALAIEVRIDDAEVQELVGKLDSPGVAAQVRAERAFLAELGADCHLPVAVHASLHGLRLRLRAMVLDPEGTERVEGSAEGESRAPDTLGFTLGRELLQRGARRLVESSSSR
jgi:hydroxymethylbilane synthase